MTPHLAPHSSPRNLLIVIVIYFVGVHNEIASAASPVVGLWRFNEGAGTNVTDSSGLNNNGILAGENDNIPSWVPGKPNFGSALKFINDGANHAYVDIPGTNTLMIGQSSTNAWTITAWAYEDSNGTGDFVDTYGRILVLDGGDAFQFESGASGDGQIYTWSRHTPAWQIGWGTDSAVAPVLDEWVHWAVVYNGTNLTIFRNGNQGTHAGTASNAVTAALGYAGYRGAIQIGSELAQPANRTWNGMLDDVAVFAGALAENEIQTVMTGDFSAHLGGPAHIITQPQGQTIPQGSDVSFAVGAQGLAPVSYQWYYNTTNLLLDATNTILSLTNVQKSRAGNYSVTVSNALGIEVSAPAVLIVNVETAAIMVGLWRFNEGAGTNVTDSSGLNNNGMLAGENDNIPSWVPGKPNFGSALKFINDGANHAYVDIPGTNTLMIGQSSTNAWTITAWAYEDSNGTGDFVDTYGRILVLDGGDAFQFESGASGDAQIYTWSRHTPAWQIGWGTDSAVAPVLDEWVHWAVVYNGTNLTIYRNGNQGTHAGTASNTVTAALGYAGYTGAIQIGSELAQPANRTWNGMLDDVAVFNTALSEVQINAVMSGDFSAFVAHPSLSIYLSQGNVVLSWTASSGSFQLQSSPTLSPPQWSDDSAKTEIQGSLLVATVPIDSQTKFFRLIAR